MNEILSGSVFFGAFISLFFYEIGLMCRRRWRLAIVNPLLIAIVLTAAFLIIFNIDYDTYNSSARYLSWLLTPATVCLAVPLYEQLELLKKHCAAILAGIVAGVLTSVVLVLLLSMLLGLSHAEYVTFLPKSVTSAIGMAMAERLGGYPAISVAVIIITGIFGNILAEPLLKLFHVTEPVAKGIGIGTSSHAIGTAKAVELGELEGAVSGLSIAVSGLLTVFVSILFARLY